MIRENITTRNLKLFRNFRTRKSSNFISTNATLTRRLASANRSHVRIRATKTLTRCAACLDRGLDRLCKYFPLTHFDHYAKFVCGHVYYPENLGSMYPPTLAAEHRHCLFPSCVIPPNLVVLGQTVQA